MKTYKFLFILLLIAGINSCTGNQSNKNKEDSVKTKEENQSLQTIQNDRYNFSFVLPAKWKALDESDNGDGFVIQTDDSKVDFRIYARQTINDESGDNYIKTEEFTFDDGSKGTKCYYSDTEYFIFKNKENTGLAFYISANQTWIRENSKSLLVVAKSLKFTH